MTTKRRPLFDDFDNHLRKPLPLSSTPHGRRKRELTPATHLILDDMLPNGWRYRADGERNSWRAIAWARDGRYIEARARTWQHALAELTHKIADVRSNMQVAPPRPDGYEDPPPQWFHSPTTNWRWSTDAEEFLEEICLGIVTQEKQRWYLARFMSDHPKEFAVMPAVLRKELAIRRVLPGSYWSADSSTK